jgi:hypothetical protein
MDRPVSKQCLINPNITGIHTKQCSFVKSGSFLKLTVQSSSLQVKKQDEQLEMMAQVCGGRELVPADSSKSDS